MPLAVDVPKLWLPPKPAIIRPARHVWRPPIRVRDPIAMLPGIIPVNAGGGGGPSKTLEFIDTAVNTANLTTYTFTSRVLGDAQADRYIIVVALTGTASRTLMALTVGGVSARIVCTITGTSGTSRNAGLAIANVPTGTVGDIAATWSSGCVQCGIGWWRATGLSSEIENDFGTTTSDPGAIPLDTVAGGFVVGGIVTSSGGSFSWTNVTERYDQAAGENNTIFSGADATGTSAGTLSVQADDSGTGVRAMVAASW